MNGAAAPRFLGRFANSEEGSCNDAVSDLQGYGHQLARLRSDHMVDFRYDSGSSPTAAATRFGGARPQIADGEKQRRLL